MGGGIDNSGVLTLTDSTLSGNSGVGSNDGIRDYGGGLANYGTATITGCTISGNSSYTDTGGLLNAANATLMLTDCTISGNSATGSRGYGGGLTNDGTATLTDCTISGNFATGAFAYGGGLANDGTATLTDCTISGNSATRGAGGLEDGYKATLTLTDCTISGNSATEGQGGGLENGPKATLMLTDCTISRNSASPYGGDGGGLSNYGAVTLTDCTISGNSSTGGGGGLLLNYGGTAVLTDCTVSGNSANGGDSAFYHVGGGILNASTLTLTGCTLSNNYASVDGGGLDNFRDATLENCTISGNSARVGAGLYNAEDLATTTLINSTVSGNSAAASGGGIASNSGTLTIGNTLVAANTASAGPDGIGSHFTSLGHNLIGETDDSAGWVSTDLTGTSAQPLHPLLAPLGYYGGPTATMLLLPGSPAIDAGNNTLIPAGVTTDQRGYPRIVNGTVDLGAFESQSIPLVVNTTADGTDVPPGKLSFREAIDLANILGGAETITFDPTVFATPQTITLTEGQLELSDTTGAVTITGPPAGVTISGDGLSRVLQIDSGVTATITGLTMMAGSTTGYGGGLYDDGGTATLTDCTLSGSSAIAGGALFTTKRGTTTVIGCAFTGNSAVMGGGLYDSGGTTNLTDCTVSGNSASAGGGLFNTKRGTTTVIGCTFGANFAAQGGGIDNTGYGSAMLEDTIVATNLGTGGSSSDIGGASATNVVGTYDLVGTGGAGGIAGGTGDIVLNNLSTPLLAPLGSYGGPTQTMPVLPGSAAIGAGTSVSGLTTDQRGFALPANPDIGAVQTPLELVVNTTVELGELSLRQAINLANSLGGTQTITFDPTVFATQRTITLTQGQITLSDTSGTESIVGPTAGVTISGGGLSRVFEIQSGSTASISGVTITGGSAGNGGAVQNYGTITVTDCSISGNSAASNGGGVDNEGSAILSNCTISGNSAGDNGGAIHNSGFLTVSDSTLSNNSAAFGGAIANYETLDLSSTSFTNNQASDMGGAIDNADSGTLVMSGGFFSNDGASFGGAVENYSAAATLTDVTFSGNSATTSGGAVDNYAGDLTLTNCTISGNSASVNGGGLNIDNTTATLTDCTISGNSATGGSGLYNTSSSSVTLTDTIVAGNTAVSGASDIGGNSASRVTGTYNLVGTGGSGGITNGSNGNIVLTSLTNLGLAPLGDYSGTTETMALLPNSAAIGAGTGISGITTDERGAPRPTSGAVDIGAFQNQGYTLVVSLGSAQSTAVDQAFPASLAVLLTESFSNAPIAGAPVDFSAPSSGASATLGASSVITNASGMASVAATANGIAGTYVVTASAADTNPVAFTLINIDQPTFSGLTNQTVTYGGTVTLTGTLAAGLEVPDEEDVAVTVDGVTHDAKIGSDGSFSTEFSGADVVLNASATSYNVTYNYTGDGTFLAASGSSQLTVNPAELTITATSDTKVYDGTTSSSQTPTYSTLFNGNTVTGLTQAFESKNALGSGGSSLVVTGYTVNDGDGGKDYRVTTETAAGTITPAPLTIDATAQAKLYDGTTTSTAAPTYSGLMTVGGDTITGLSQAYASKNVLGNGGSTLNVTAYSINDGNGGNDYTVTTETAPGTISPAPLTVRAQSASIVYGSPLPAFTYTITGFVGGENSSVVTGSLLITTTAASGANAGTYAITPAAGTLSAPNYSLPAVDLITGTLTITPAPLVITAVSTSMLAGQPVPPLTAAYSGFVNGDTPANLLSPPVLHSPASPTSPPGVYAITASGASSPNYTFTYVAGSLTVILPPATVLSARVETVKLSKHKTVQEIVLQFSEALDAATAQSISSYTLTTVTKKKTQKSKPVQLSQASYNPLAFTVTLLARKPLTVNPPLELTVEAASLLDAFGRELDGNNSGQSGANFTAVFSKSGTSVLSARALSQRRTEPRVGGSPAPRDLGCHSKRSSLHTYLTAPRIRPG